MKALAKALRIGLRLLWIALEVARAFVGFVALPNRRFDARALWLHKTCRRVLRVFGLRVASAGSVPDQGLLVSNHLSYLDIIVLAALTPAVFVSKREVKFWPVFGWLAALAGTVFVNRRRATDVTRVNARIRSLLDNGALVVVFPESTTSDGRTVLAFKSSLLEPAAHSRHVITASCIRYSLDDGDVPSELCYWGDMTFVPHLLNLLSKARVEASVTFHPLQPGRVGRKQLAQRLHAEVVRLREAPVLSSPSRYRASICATLRA
jgi:lyso-ornithine lipid O-acyltransferase